MIKHIVMWRLKETGNGQSKSENLKQMKAMLEALPAKISEIVEFEVGIDFDRSERAFDMVLVSAFASKETLKAYQIHPEHQKVVAFLPEIVAEGKVVDYEV